MIKYLLLYYIISGIIVSVLSFRKRKMLAREINPDEPIGYDVVVLYNFLTGFLQLPVVIVLGIYLMYLNNKNKHPLQK